MRLLALNSRVRKMKIKDFKKYDSEGFIEENLFEKMNKKSQINTFRLGEDEY